MAITVNGTPGISATAVATLTNKTLEAPVINNATFTGQQAGLQVAFNDSIVFEGTTADAYETTLSAGEPTADRTVTLPNATDTLVGKATTDTLTNKSISLTTNTISGTTAEFNTALSDGDFATLAGSETLTNKTLTTPTLTTPRFASAGEIDDANGAELIKFTATVASAVNEVTITNAATGDGATTGRPTISATGDDTNIALNLVSKGSGTVQANGVPVATTTGTQTLTNKTLSAGTLTGTLTAGGGVGTTGQVLQSTGTGVQWATASSASGNDPSLVFAVQIYS